MAATEAKTLIIKVGATGDVVRTTPLLHSIDGEIHWLTSAYNAAVLPVDCSKLTQVFIIEKDLDTIAKHGYNCIISIDEDPAVKDLLKEFNPSRIMGLCADKNGLRYTREAADWFDMSLVSTFDKQQADGLKFENRKTYQDLIFKIGGKDFTGQPYWINLPAANKAQRTVGIETRAGSRWKGKAWWGYDLLAAELKDRGYDIVFFSQRDTLQAYMKDIGSCNFIITGDTLAMHIALAYGLPTLSLFTCTAPWEIYDYGLLHKVVSPLLKKSFYQSEPVPEVIQAISIDMVLNEFLQMTRKSMPEN